MWALVTFHFFACGTKSVFLTQFLPKKRRLEVIHFDFLLPFWVFPLWGHTDASTSPRHDALSSPGCHKCHGNAAAARWSWAMIANKTYFRAFLSEHASSHKQQKTLVNQNKWSCQINLFWQIINILWESNTWLTTTIWLVGLKTKTSASSAVQPKKYSFKGQHGRASVRLCSSVLISVLVVRKPNKPNVKLWGAAWASQELEPKTGLNRSMPKPHSPTE